MDIILVPGLWLDGASWGAVAAALEAAGHHPLPVTLPGLEAPDADRSRVTYADHVATVVAAVDAAGDAPVVLVGHSAGAAVVHAVVDARPDRVARAIYVGGFPAADGDAIVEGLDAIDGEVPLPPFASFSDDDLRDLDEAMLTTFRDRAIPSPAAAVDGPQRLTDPRRYGVPVTVVCTEFTSEMLQQWIEAGFAPVSEFSRIEDVEFVDLPTGHWPQFSRPAELARIIADRS